MTGIAHQVELGRDLQIGGERLFRDPPVRVEGRKAGARLRDARHRVAARLAILLHQIGQSFEIEGIETVDHSRSRQTRYSDGQQIGRAWSRELVSQYV